MTALLISIAFGLVLCLALGLAFSAAESTTLTYNRARLLQRFGDEQTESATEQEIIRETKDVYLISRFGLAISLVGACYCVGRLLWAGLARLWPVDVAAGAALVVTPFVLTPFAVLIVFAAPRILTRRRRIASRSELPDWILPFVRIFRPVVLVGRAMTLLPLGRLLPLHELTKNDLVSLVTDLEFDEDEEEVEDDAAESETVEGEEEEQDEEEIIYNILDLEETYVREVMEPINSVVAVRLGDMTVEGLCDLARRTGFSRFPVYRDRIVNLVGHISIYDILREEQPGSDLEAYVTAAYFVPEFMPVSRLLREFLARGIHVAVVVDEYGGTSGWITREDVLEEIVGEIEDEFDAASARMEKLSENVYVVDGDLDIDDLSEQLPLRFSEPQYDTVAGLILMDLAEIPEVGAEVETDQATYRVMQMEGNRIARVRIELHVEEEE